MAQYNRIQLDSGGQLYQIVWDDMSITFASLDGVAVDPVGGYRVVSVNEPAPVWAAVDTTGVAAHLQTESVITKLEYMNRFHDDELATLYTAAKANVQIEIWLEKFKLAEFIDLPDARTIAGVQALEAAGIIGTGRAAEILG